MKKIFSMLARSFYGCCTMDLLPATSRFNLTQRRFRRRTMKPPPFVLPKLENIYKDLNEKDR